ncbi:MAG: four helix bundle protein [Bacteroidetes bacterium]|nr:four helix bundle protein [Bacteroidota bacterium]
MEIDNYNLESDIVEEESTSYNSDKDFTTLEAWRKARIVKLFFYKEIIPFVQNEEKHNLAFQIRKASVSITANIAEGYGRFHYKEGIQFYRISRGSLFELKDHVISCFDMQYINKAQFEKALSLIEDAKITINGYINFVKKQLQNEK